MLHIQWGTLIYQILIFIFIVGVPIAALVWFLTRRKSKIKELERRIERLEKEQKYE